MNYDEFRAWRNELLTRRSPRRLDCMNPEMALAHLRPAASELPGASLPETAERWLRLVGLAIPIDRLILGSGIRPILDGLFAVLARSIETLWLPEDVYPVYWQLSAHCRRQGFATLPDLDWSMLDAGGPRDALLLTHPISPVGRYFSDGEVERLRAWLAAGSGRLLILDGAYSFETASMRGLDQRLQSDQIISIWSMSKPWLSRGIFGAARVPAALRADVQARVAVPTSSQVARAAALLESAPTLPAVVRERFRAAWARLMPGIRAACPAWQPPESGYFSVVSAPFEDLLAQHELLAVPASVFGSRRADLSVVSCLFDIELHDASAAR
jgi:histidinol-phosphate/aromatic aminotransferase/cobyric acid decarboxylase-like protein